MANDLGYYDPIFYTQEGLILLNKTLGRAGRVHRGYDNVPQNKGDTIRISQPSTFVAQDAPSPAQNIETKGLEIKLNYWKDVKFFLSDRDLALSRETIIADHIQPAVQALAEDVDEKLAMLANDIPWYYDLAATTEYKDLTRVKKILRENKAPMQNGKLHYALSPDLESGFVELFANSNFSGQSSQELQMYGSLGIRGGVELFSNDSCQYHEKGTCSTSTLAVNGAALKGAQIINLDAGTVTGTLVPGDSFIITGSKQRHAITNTTTATGNAFSGVTFVPPLPQNVADNATVTVRLKSHTQNLMFHEHAFALATAPLSEIGNEFGAKIFSTTDTESGLSLRTRLYYDGTNSGVACVLDLLYGVKTLNPNLACIAAAA